MRKHDVDRLLGEWHRPGATGRASHRDALREARLRRHREEYAQRKRWIIMVQKSWFRPVLAGLVLLILGIVACTAPTKYDVEMGQKLGITLENASKLDDLQAQLQEITSYLKSQASAEKVSVELREVSGGPASAELTVWGQNLDSEGLLSGLRAQFPFLAEANIEVTPLVGTAEGSLAEAVGHGLFRMEIQGQTAEEIRQQILDQLASQGLQGDAQVEIVDGGDGERTVSIEVRAGCPEGEGMQNPDSCCAGTIELKAP